LRLADNWLDKQERTLAHQIWNNIENGCEVGLFICVCLLLAPRKPATKPGNVKAVKNDTSSSAAAEAAVRHVDDGDGDDEDDVEDAETRLKSSQGNGSRHVNKSNSASDVGCSSKKSQHNVMLSSPNK